MTVSTEFSLKKRINSANIRQIGLVFFLLSFAGWCFEKVGRYIFYGSIDDRGFLSMPLCPIYGTSVLLIYFIIGSPQSFLIRVKSEGGRSGRFLSSAANFLLYFIFTALIASAVELFTGAFFKEVFGVALWNYADRFMNFGGYICLSFGLLWGALITLFMFFVWDRLLNWSKKLNARAVGAVSLGLSVLCVADFIFNIIYLLKNQSHFNFL